jgi:hypothetical protein
MLVTCNINWPSLYITMLALSYWWEFAQEDESRSAFFKGTKSSVKLCCVIKIWLILTNTQEGNGDRCRPGTRSFGTPGFVRYSDVAHMIILRICL